MRSEFLRRTLLIFFICGLHFLNIKANGVLSTDVKLFDGKIVPITSHPYLVHIVIEETRQKSLCGGIILSGYTILSAAHCFKNKQEQAKNVNVFGGSMLLESGTKYTIRKIFHYVDFNKGRNDISLLQLNAPLSLVSTMRHAFLPPPRYEMQPGTSVKLIGWIAASSKKDLRLLEVPLKITKPLQCIDCFKRDYRFKKMDISDIQSLMETLICAKNECPNAAIDPRYMNAEQKSCHSNSTGFLIRNKMIVGITTYALECDVVNPHIFTKLSHYVEWIGENMASDVMKSAHKQQSGTGYSEASFGPRSAQYLLISLNFCFLVYIFNV